MSIVSFSLVNWILSVVMGRSTAYLLLHIFCLFDLLDLCSCRRGNLLDDDFPGLAVVRSWRAIFRPQRAVHHVGQRFHDRIIRLASSAISLIVVLSYPSRMITST